LSENNAITPRRRRVDRAAAPLDTRMDGQKAMQLFEDKRIRAAWDEEAGEWYFSIVGEMWGRET